MREGADYREFLKPAPCGKTLLSEPKRTTLCAFHHLRGVHAGRVRCQGRAPEGLQFELGLRPGAEPLMRFGAGDLRMS